LGSQRLLAMGLLALLGFIELLSVDRLPLMIGRSSYSRHLVMGIARFMSGASCALGFDSIGQLFETFVLFCF
jgi:hypothetical protein